MLFVLIKNTETAVENGFADIKYKRTKIIILNLKSQQKKWITINSSKLQEHSQMNESEINYKKIRFCR